MQLSQNFPNTKITASDEISIGGENLWAKTSDNNVATLMRGFLYKGAPMRMARNDAELHLSGTTLQ